MLMILLFHLTLFPLSLFQGHVELVVGNYFTLTPGAPTTVVKRLNRYFCFLFLGFHLPVREKWAKMHKSVSQHNYLSIFLKILSFFR